MQTIQLLLVEDSDDDALLLCGELRRGGLEVSCHRVETEAELLQSLAAQAWDIIISDYSLPKFSGPRALSICRQSYPELPFLIVSGAIGEETAVEVMRAGADDYLLKGRLQRLPSAVKRALGEAATRKAKEKAERELASTHEQLREQAEIQTRIMESLVEGILLAEPCGSLLYVNSAAKRVLGIEGITSLREQPPGLEFFEVDACTPIPWEKTPLRRGLAGAEEPAEFFIRGGNNPDGKWVESGGRPLLGEGSQQTGSILVLRDITARKQSEKIIEGQQLSMLAASKLSTLGEMAGGVAHEINNPLTAVLGFADQLHQRASNGELELKTVKDFSSRIVDSAIRIGKIVRGLRSISRNAEGDPMQPVSLQTLIEDSIELCREKLRTRDINLRLKGAAAVLLECRAAEINQLVMNLLNNACDAIEGLPERWIEVETRVADPWIEIAITDSGHGIPSEIREKVFTPFFTTKKVGKGTGLGLSICKRLAEAHGGGLVLDTDSAHTRFLITLPMLIPSPDPAL